MFANLEPAQDFSHPDSDPVLSAQETLGAFDGGSNLVYFTLRVLEKVFPFPRPLACQKRILAGDRAFSGIIRALYFRQIPVGSLEEFE